MTNKRAPYTVGKSQVYISSHNSRCDEMGNHTCRAETKFFYYRADDSSPTYVCLYHLRQKRNLVIIGGTDEPIVCPSCGYEYLHAIECKE